MLADALGFSKTEIIKYVRVKTVRQHSSGHTTVGLGSPFRQGGGLP